ncbi:hypothetical protein CARUB_v10022122mg [Capsella rubella]|uniref:Uncharacterized protein n=1 Tax=Capsella rubella TaxID=81985 RepID=R0ID36_9BRAS|nr:uncharacterized protein LOC17895856 [Capsella rubella]EOA34568.1 hypothetical protein CARUB_v10022122mg [Capsella rubella]
MTLVAKLLLMVLVVEVVCANVGARPLEEVSKHVMDKKTVPLPSLPPLGLPKLPELPTPVPIPPMKSSAHSRVRPIMANGGTGRVSKVPYGATARGYGSASGSSHSSGRTHP